MTIEYKDSKRIVGLSTDIVQTLTFEDDFSSDNWTNIEGSSVGVSGGVLAYNAYTGGGSSGDGEYRDYGSVLSDTFVWRFKWNATNIVKGSNLANNEVNISISSNTSKNDIVNDAVGFLLRVDSANKQLNAGIWDNTAPASTASTNTALEASTFSAGTYYCEVVRLSNRQFKFTLYSDSNFSTSAYTTTLTNPADLLDLRYFKVTTDHETSADSANDGSLDDFKLYNGVTSITSKPTNVQDNSLLVEKDTARRYWFDAESARTPTYENTSAVSLGTGDSGTSIDMTGSTLDDSWVLRFKVTMTSLGTGSSLLFMIQDSTTTTVSTARDGIGLRQTDSSSYYDFEGCNAVAGNAGQYDHRFTTTPAVDTKYVQITRTSATSAKIEFYDSTYTTVSESSGDITIANITGLRYFVISNNGSALTVDDIDFWNGVTSATIPATWTIRPTYESNFTVDNWLDQDSTYIGVDTSANQLDFAVKRDSTRASSVDMLGETISETKWILRWDMVTTTHTQSAGNANNCWFGISSLPSSTAGYSAKDWLGLWIDLRQTDSASNTYAETCTAQGNHVGTKSTAFTSKAWFADNYTFGLQLQRISADSFKVSIFDSHDYDNEIESQTVTTSSSVNNLRYLGIWNANDSAFPNTYSGYTPRIRFWNNLNEGDLT